MPAFNAERTIQHAIESVLGQDYQNWELLITDDGSTDSTSAILARFTDPRIRTFRQPNGGVSSARNRGLSEMKGVFYTFLDADDLLPPSSLSLRVAHMISRPEIDLLAGGVAFFVDDPSQPHRIWRPGYRGDPLRPLVRLDSRVFCNPSYFLRADPHSTVKYSTELTHGEDLLYFLELAAERRLHFDHLNEVVYCYRMHQGSAMSNLRGLEDGYWRILAFVSSLADARITIFDKIYLRLRIARIMLLSYLKAGEVKCAVRVLLRVFSPSTSPFSTPPNP